MRKQDINSGLNKPHDDNGAITNGTALSGAGAKVKGAHQERWVAAGMQTEDFLAMIHTEIPVEKVFGIPGAKDAVDKEWKKLFDINSFALDKVMGLEDIKKMYKKKRRTSALRIVENDMS